METGQKSKRIGIRCGKCASEIVTRDAWAEWDLDRQEWCLAAVYDYAFCHDCEDDTRLEEFEIQ